MPLLKQKKAPALASLAILAFAALMFYPALFQGKILAPLDITTSLLQPWAGDHADPQFPHNHNPSDAVTQYLPYRMFIEKSLREDGYIGWNPYEMGGYNMAANTMALPANWTMQLHRVLSFKDAWNWGIIIEFLIAGFGMLIFLRSQNIGWIPSLIGAIAFMANSQFAIWLYHRWALSTFCWMPWLLWASVGWKGWGDWQPKRTIIPAFIALALMGGTLQHMLFVFFVTACVAAAQLPPIRQMHTAWRLVAGWATVWLLATSIAAFTIIPQIQAYLINNELGHIRGGIGYPHGPLQPVFNLFFIPAQSWPWLIGSPQTIDGFRIFKAGYMSVAYFGTITIMLAFLGIFHRRIPPTAKWLLLVGLLVPLTPLVGPLYHRVQLLFILGGAWAAALLIQHFATNPSILLRRTAITAYSVLVVALIIGALLPDSIRASIEQMVVTQSVEASVNSNFGSHAEWIESRAIRWTDRFSINNPYTLWLVSILGLGCAGLAMLGIHKPRVAAIAPLLILASCGLELLTLFKSAATFEDPAFLKPPHTQIDRVQALAGNHRVIQRPGDAAFAEIFATPNLLASYFTLSYEGYESIHYIRPAHALRMEDPVIRLAASGVGIAVIPAGATPHPGTEAWPVIDSPGAFEIRQNPAPVSIISSGSGEVPTAIDQLASAFASAEPIIPIRQTMNHATLTVPQHADWIRYGQNWHPGWTWSADGIPPTRFTRGPDDTSWIEDLPVGIQEIHVQFSPRPAWLTIFSIIFAIAALIIIITAHTRKVAWRRELRVLEAA